MNWTPRSLWKKLIELLDCPLGHYPVIELLDSIGARFIGGGCFSRAYVVTFGSVSLVYKFSKRGKSVNVPDESDLEENPVLREHYLRPIFRVHPRLLVQPLCDDNIDYNEAEELRERLKKASYHNTDFDAHGGNVGYFRGKLRIFDAMSAQQRYDLDNGNDTFASDCTDQTPPSCYDSCPSVAVTGTPLSQRTKQETFH